MHRPFKAIAFVCLLTSFAALALGLSLYKVAVANAFLRLRAVEEAPVAVAGGDAQAQRLRGKHLVAVLGCQDCHGQRLQGKILLDRPGYLVAAAPNLTPAAAVGRWDAARWQRTLRLGVDGEWRALWWMPRATLMQLAQSDVEALGSYLQTLAPEANALPQSHLGALGYADVALRRLVLVDRTPLVAAGKAAPWPQEPPAAHEPGFGAYLATVGRCGDCHGPAYRQVTDPSTRRAGTLRRADSGTETVATWIRGLRQGRCPDGRDPAERGAPSRMLDWSQAEGQALFDVLARP